MKEYEPKALPLHLFSYHQGLSSDKRMAKVGYIFHAAGKLFPDTTVGQVMQMFGSLPEEVAALRKASAHVIHLQHNLRKPKTGEGK